MELSIDNNKEEPNYSIHGGALIAAQDEEILKELKIPEGLKPVLSISPGYAAKEETPKEHIIAVTNISDDDSFVEPGEQPVTVPDSWVRCPECGCIHNLWKTSYTAMKPDNFPFTCKKCGYHEVMYIEKDGWIHSKVKKV